jgi:hypothetical protein
MTMLERAIIVIAAVALAGGVIAATSGVFGGSDQGQLTGGAPGPGQAYPDQGDAPLSAGARRPAYDSDPPTSGPHFSRPVTRDQAPLSTDQLLTALQAGDVVVMYPGVRPPAGLTAWAASVAPAFTPALAAAGQAVILAPRPGTLGLIGLAWAHAVRVSTATDTLLGAFASYWLGRGAPRRSG